MKRLQVSLHRRGKQRARTVECGGELEVESDDEYEEKSSPAADSGDVAQAAAAPPPPHVTAIAIDGAEIAAEEGIMRAIDVLESGLPLSVGDLGTQIGVDLSQPANAAFRRRLLQSSGVTARAEQSGLVLQKRAPMGVDSLEALQHLFTRRLPSGEVCSQSGNPASAISEQELDGAYRGITNDLDHLVAERLIAEYPVDSRTAWRIFVPRMPWAASSPHLTRMWKATPRPASGSVLRQSAAAAGVRCALHMDATDQRNRQHKERLLQSRATEHRSRAKQPRKGASVVIATCAVAAGGRMSDVDGE